jgi:hypothetical protein
MSFIVAGCVLLLALLAGIAIDDIGIRRGKPHDANILWFDSWRLRIRTNRPRPDPKDV